MFLKYVNLNKSTKNAFYLLIGTALPKVLVLFSNFFLAFLFSTSEFGFYSLLKSTATTATTIAMFSLNMIVTKNVSEACTNNYASQSINEARGLTRYFIILGIIILTVFQLLVSYNGIYDFLSDLSVIALYTFSMMNISENAIAVATSNTKLLVKANLYSTMAIPFIIVLPYFFNSFGAMIGLAIYYLFQSIVIRNSINNIFEINNRSVFFSKASVDKIRSVLREMTPLVVITLLTALPFYIIKVLLFMKGGAKSLGLFEFAFQWFVLASTITNTIIFSFIPKIARYKKGKLIKLMKNQLIKSLIFRMTLVNTGILILGIVSAYLIEKLTVLKYLGLTKLVVIMLIGNLFYSILLIIEKVFINFNKAWLQVWVYATYIIIFLSYVLFVDMKPDSIALGLLFGYLFSSLIAVILLDKRIK